MGWVRKLFAELQGNYGTRFLDMWRSGQADTNGDDVGLQNAMDMWADKLAGFRDRPDAIRRVLDTLPPHPPTLPEFVALIRQSCPKPEHKALPAPDVPPAVIAAFWALETDFGGFMGSSPTIQSIATLAWDCRRPRPTGVRR